MKTALLALPLAGAAVFGLAACNHSTTVSADKAKASSAATSQNAKNAKADAQKLVKGCWPANQASLLTHGGRVALADCVKIPPAHKQAFENCVIVAVEHDHVTTHAGRETLVNDAFPTCVVTNR